MLSDRGISSAILFKAPEVLIDDNCANIGAVTDIFVLLDVDKTPCALSPVYLHKSNPIDIQGILILLNLSRFTNSGQKVDKQNYY